MTNHDPFRNYDAWLEAPIQRQYEQAEAELEAWEEFCADRNGPPTTEVQSIIGTIQTVVRTPVVPVEAAEPDHADHAIFVAWAALEAAISTRYDRLDYEAYAADREADWDMP